MKCPFRGRKEYKYTELGEGAFVTESETDEFPECYLTECHCYKWDPETSEYYCLQTKILQAQFVEDEE